MRLCGVESPLRRDVLASVVSQQANERVSQRRQHLPCGSFAHAAAILAKGDVADIVIAVLDRSATAQQGKETFGLGFFRGKARDAVHDLLARHALPPVFLIVL